MIENDNESSERSIGGQYPLDEAEKLNSDHVTPVLV